MVALARVRGAPDEVVKAVRGAGLQDAEDSAVSEMGALLLAWAYCETGRADEALAAVSAASQKHPDRPRLVLQQASLALGLGRRSPRGHVTGSPTC